MNKASENKRFIYEFGKFVLDPHERVLLADGKPVHLTDKVFDTLLFLLENNGRLLTKDEMMTSIWEESFVEESNLAKNISRLRKILNADGVSRIETLPKRGYRFLADVKEIDGATSFLVRRNLRVKITHTVEDETPDLGLGIRDLGLADDKKKIPESAIRNPQSKRLLLALGALAVVIISVLGFYFWKREKSVLQTENGAIRLTDNPKNDTRPHWTNDGRIRFLRTGSDKETESVVMNSDGTNQTEVKDFNNLKYGFWSPDGKKVVFAKRGDKTAYYLANADGEHEIALPFFSGNFDWSPDNQKIVYQKKVGENEPEIFVYSLETGKSENVTDNPAFDADPSFSPDGKQIVFASNRDGNYEIYNLYVMNADGGNGRQIYSSKAGTSLSPAWSPDGASIVFANDKEDGRIGNFELFNIEIDAGATEKRLTFRRWIDSHPAFSPDGKHIAFVSNTDGNMEVYVQNADGTGLLRVTRNLAEDITPQFSKDGTRIIFSSNRNGKFALYEISIIRN